MNKQVKTSELSGSALDWAVAKSDGLSLTFHHSTWWTHGGHIIERERITLRADTRGGSWAAFLDGARTEHRMTGETPLIAAMRCYVASKLGETVEIPEELTK